MKKRNYEWIVSELILAEEEGIVVQVDGICYNNYNKAELLMVVEDLPYMKEYLDNERGKIIQINFNKVKEY